LVKWAIGRSLPTREGERKKKALPSPERKEDLADLPPERTGSSRMIEKLKASVLTVKGKTDKKEKI